MYVSSASFDVIHQIPVTLYKDRSNQQAHLRNWKTLARFLYIKLCYKMKLIMSRFVLNNLVTRLPTRDLTHTINLRNKRSRHFSAGVSRADRTPHILSLHTFLSISSHKHWLVDNTNYIWPYSFPSLWSLSAGEQAEAFVEIFTQWNVVIDLVKRFDTRNLNSDSKKIRSIN